MTAPPGFHGRSSRGGSIVRTVSWRARELAFLCLLIGPAIASAEDPAGFEGRAVTAIALQGNKVTREDVIRRELETEVGAPLSNATLEADLGRLINLQVFAEQHWEAEADGDGVRLILVVKEMPALVLYPAISYTEENGFSYGLAVSALNLKGESIKLSGRAQFGGTDQYWGRFSWPWISGNHLSLDFYGAALERDDKLNHFRERSLEISPTLGTWIGRAGRLRGTLSYFQMRSDVAGKTISPDNQDRFWRVGAVGGYDTRDDWTNPRRGWRNELEVIGTLGTSDFVSMNLDLRRYQPTAANQQVLLSGLLSLQSGTVGTDVPPYLTYHVGGANSIRGYDFNDLTAEQNGKNQLLTTAEYAVTLLQPRRHDIFRWSFRLGLQLAAFGDAGIAWSEAPQFGWKRFRGGIGVGLRALVPGTEQVRFDVGWSPNGGLEFHLASGNKPDAQRRRLR
jgi:outer membrane protein assembly factor BamA